MRKCKQETNTDVPLQARTISEVNQMTCSTGGLHADKPLSHSQWFRMKVSDEVNDRGEGGPDARQRQTLQLS